MALKFRGVNIGPFASFLDVYLKISSQWFDPAEPAKFCSQVNAMRRRERKGHAKTTERRKIVPGVSSLTTCDELREAKNEIKRVPENSRGSARSNYLRKVRSVRTDRGVDIFFSVFPLFLHRTSFRRFIFFAASAERCGYATGNRKEGKKISGGIFFWIYFFLRSALAYNIRREERGNNETWNSRNSIRRINYNVEDPHGARRTAGRNLISLANEFLSKSRVSCLM